MIAGIYRYIQSFHVFLPSRLDPSHILGNVLKKHVPIWVTLEHGMLNINNILEFPAQDNFPGTSNNFGYFQAWSHKCSIARLTCYNRKKEQNLIKITTNYVNNINNNRYALTSSTSHNMLLVKSQNHFPASNS